MTTATSFVATGRGNGFVSCVQRRTFNPAKHSGLYTLHEAMQLYWNTKSIEITGGDPDGFQDILPDAGVNYIEPFKRVCNIAEQFLQPFSFSDATTHTLANDDDIENIQYVGFDESEGGYFLNIPEIIFSGYFGFESFLVSGNNAFDETGRGNPYTDESGVAKTWTIDAGLPTGVNPPMTLKFNFYTY